MRPSYNFIWAILLPSISLIKASTYWDSDEFERQMAEQMTQMQDQIQNAMNPELYTGFRSYPFHGNHYNFDLGDSIARNVRLHLEPLNFLGRNIRTRVQNELKPLENLGQRIEDQVNKGLQPVRALEVYGRMANGVGGTTVVIYPSPHSKKFLIMNGQTFECTDGKMDNSPMCASKTPFVAKTMTDYCFSHKFARINDMMCVSGSPHSSLSVSVINNNIKCSSSDGSPTLLTTETEFRKNCGVVPWEVQYTYYANTMNPSAVKIPNDNPFVVCDNAGPGICTFDGSKAFGTSSSGHSINIVQSTIY